MNEPKVEVFKPGKREWLSFWSLIGMQSTNAFNDNFAKFILIPLCVGLAAKGLAPENMEYVLGGLLVLPFILFAPTAGWLGDRFAKSTVIRWSSWFQLFVLLMMGGGLWFGARYGGEHSSFALTVVVIAFFLLALQSALLSPSKMGVVKELVGTPRLGFANGVMEGTVIIAILLGQILGGFSYDVWGLQVGREPWAAAMVPVLWVLIGAGVSLVLSHSIHPTKTRHTERFSWAVATRHFHDLGKLVNDRPMWRCTLGISFFWGFGGFLQFLLLQRAEEKMGAFEGMGSEMALLWLPVVLGIVIGSLLASWICRHQNELGLVVVGGVMMTLGTLAMGLIPMGEGWFRMFLGATGCGGALFLVPLNAYLQDRAPENERGLVMSASNLCINLAGVLALALQFGLKAMEMPVWLQFVSISVICGAATIHVMRLLPKDFVRLVFLGFFRSIYKIRPLGAENIPREGGVLLVANHVSYIDAFVLSAACPRPIRFVMFADCFEDKWVGKFARFFDAVPISSTKARDAIRVASEALKEGGVVCLFAEGQFTRTGALCELKRGYQMMARKAGCLVLPAYMDGLWGSIWSFSEGNFLRKLPRTLRYGVSVAFGKPVEAATELGPELRSLSVLTSADRERQLWVKKNREPRLIGDLPRGWSSMMDRSWADDESGRSMRQNALQLGQVHLASHRSRMLVEWRPDDELSGILGILWPLSLGARVSLVDDPTDGEILSKVLREELDFIALRSLVGREDLVRRLAAKGLSVWSFDDFGVSDGTSFGCLVQDQRVVSFALSDPDFKTTTQLPQSGWKAGTRGKLLPGWPQEKFGELDEEGFLVDTVTG